MESSDKYGVPVRQFIGGVSNYFPRPGKQHSLETAMEKRIEYVVKPTNASNEGFTGDGFVEYRIVGVPGQFLDLSELVLDIEGYLVWGDGTLVAVPDAVQLCNLGICTIIKTVSVFLNNVQVESGINYGYTAYMRTLMDAPGWRRGSTLNLMGYTGQVMERRITDQGLALAPERNVDEFSFMAPLVLDIATCDGYLLDNVDIRIRVELANERFVINTKDPNRTPTYKLTKADLKVTKLKPMDNALQSLAKQLEKVPQTYVFDRTMYCSRPIAVGQSRVLSIIHLIKLYHPSYGLPW